MTDDPESRVGQASAQDPGVPPGTLWVIRLLTLGGFGVALFLLGIHAIAAFKATRVHGPYCRLVSFFDCDTVLNSEWGTWFGVPVAALGVVGYAALLQILFLPKARRSARGWWWACVLSAAIAGAGVWFIYLQSAVLSQTYCLWCMIEHTFGLVLFLLVWVTAFGRGTLRRGRGIRALAVGVIPVALLVAGQHLDTHSYLTQAGPTGQIDRSAHMILGNASATYFAVEGIDYTCPRCRRLAGLIKTLRATPGLGIAFIVVTVPLHPKCNAYYEKDYGAEVDPHHRHACTLAELAHAVWLADPAEFEAFHDWLFEHQPKLAQQPELAITEAARRVGADAMNSALARIRDEGRVARDVEVAEQLGVRSLPGLFAGHNQFQMIPDEPDTLLQVLYAAFMTHNEPEPESEP